MKKSIYSLLAVLAMVCVNFVFTSCDDDDDNVTVTYSMGFSKMSSSNPDFLTEMSKIESTFMNELGVSDSRFTKNGKIEDCDKAVLEACVRAYDSLKDEEWGGDYTYQVINVNSDKVVYEVTFEADDENFI